MRYNARNLYLRRTKMKSILTNFVTGISFLILFVAGAAFSEFVLHGKDATNSDTIILSATFRADKNIVPTNFSAHTYFTFANEIKSIDKDKKTKIDEIFSQIISVAKSSGICTGGSYAIEPRDFYSDNGERIIYQDLRASLDCEFAAERSSEYFDLTTKIYEILEKDKIISMSVAPLNSKISDAQTKTTKNELQSIILKDAKDYAQASSRDLGKTCKIVSIVFYDEFLNASENSNAILTGAKSDKSIPIVKEDNLSVSANFTFECN